MGCGSDRSGAFSFPDQMDAVRGKKPVSTSPRTGGGAEIRARLNIGSKIYIGSKYRLGMVAPGVHITLSKKKELIQAVKAGFQEQGDFSKRMVSQARRSLLRSWIRAVRSQER